MKVTLINPPSPFLLDERVFPYLGILSVATSWKHRGMDVEIMDLNGIKNWKKEIKSIESKLVGISSTSAQFKYAYEINRILKRRGKTTFIGGPHATAIYSLRDKGITDINTQRLEEFDMIIAGDGENASLTGKKWTKTELIDINKLPIPDRRMINIKSYKYQIDGRDATIIMTQRGCPFRCEFCCGRDIEMYSIPRQRDPKDVVKEMDYLHDEFGFSAFMWFDDEININSHRLTELAKLLKDRDYKHRGFVRSDLLVKHPKVIDHLVEAGFVELCSGIESGSDRILRIINKGTTNQINIQAARMIQEHGMKYKAFTILGHPSETYEDVMMTKRFIQEIKPDSFDVTILTPYPGSRIYDCAEPSNKFRVYRFEYKGLYFNMPDFSRHEVFYKGQGAHPCFSRTEELNSTDLLNLREELLKCI